MMTNEEFDALPIQFFMVTCYERGCEDWGIARRVQCQLPPEITTPSVMCGTCGQAITKIVPTI